MPIRKKHRSKKRRVEPKPIEQEIVYREAPRDTQDGETILDILDMQNNVEYGCIFKENLRVSSKEFFSQLLVNLNLTSKLDIDLAANPSCPQPLYHIIIMKGDEVFSGDDLFVDEIDQCIMQVFLDQTTTKSDLCIFCSVGLQEKGHLFNDANNKDTYNFESENELEDMSAVCDMEE